MSQPTVRCVVAAGALTLLLGLAGSTPAEARELRDAGSVGQWLARLWEAGISALWPWSPTLEKVGFGTDPNGNPLPPSPPSSTSCGTACNQGPGTDPDGKH